MTWADIPFKASKRILRQFAAVWLVLFFILGSYRYWSKGNHTAGSVLIGAALLVGPLGLLKPTAIRWLFVACMVLAFPIGWLVSNLLLAILFYLVFTPIAFIFRLRGRDTLNLKRDDKRTTFWLPKQTPQDVRSYFKQY